jgi:predicted transposase/invertase (TIGR01784 family)
MEYVPIWLREERDVGIKIGEEKGIKIGEEKGKEEKAIETAKNLLEMGIEIDMIAKATGLKKEEVEKLAAMASG